MTGLYTPEYKPTGNEVAVLTTSQGTIRVQLHGEDAPIHVGNFVELANKGFYNGLKFHRYVPGFVIQGGCPNTRDMTPEQVARGERGPQGQPGTGGPPVRLLPIPQVRSSTSASARSRSSTPITRCSATRWRASTSSASCVPAMLSRRSRSRTLQASI